MNLLLSTLPVSLSNPVVGIIIIFMVRKLRYREVKYLGPKPSS